jgi:hypothetical protein
VSVIVTFLGNAASYPKALASSEWPGKDLKKGSCLFKGYIPEEKPRQDIRTAVNPSAPTDLRYTNIFGKYSSLIIFPGIELLKHLQTIHVTSCNNILVSFSYIALKSDTTLKCERSINNFLHNFKKKETCCNWQF